MNLANRADAVLALVVAIGLAGVITLVGWVLGGWSLEFRTFLAVTTAGMPVVIFFAFGPFYEEMEYTKDPIDRFITMVVFEVVVVVAFAVSYALMP